MNEATNINSIATAVIAFTTSIGVLSTLDYYLGNIKGIKISIIILISIIYIISTILFIRRTKRQIK